MPEGRAPGAPDAGGPDGTEPIFHNVPALKKRLDWGYYTAPQANALDRRIPQPRGRVRGAGGPVKVTRQKDLTPASQAFIEALAATAGVKQIDDYNAEAREGVSVCQQNASGGLRYSTSIRYLDRHGPQTCRTSPPGRRRLGHARHPRRQHERPRHDDRRALCQPYGACLISATP